MKIPYEWEYLRQWCIKCTSDALDRGRHLAYSLQTKLEWGRLKKSDQAAREVVLCLTDILNEPEGLDFTASEERDFLLRYRDALIETTAAEEALHRCRQILEDIEGE